ncbi:MAG: gamma-glutamyltransferase [Balneolaceae bacterium]|nr:MAG: gamma-glutamyltransferase [Balneolaceae bacterium]
MKGAVAAGHLDTAKSAAEVLQNGGNAFDAVIAAHLTACVAEPVLSSIGGGGFLLAKPADGKPVVYDFFTHTPLKKSRETANSFYKISADFGTVLQDFRIGPGSAATPGTLKGLFAIHDDLSSMPFSVIAQPAVDLARTGVRMNEFQAEVLNIVSPIYQVNEEVKKHFSSADTGELLRERDLFRKPHFADFIETAAREGDSLFYDGEVAQTIAEVCADSGGHLTAEDLRLYSVVKRKPLRCSLFGNNFLINPAPASGGILVSFAAKLSESAELLKFTPASIEYLERLAEIQHTTNRARIDRLLMNEPKNNLQELLGGELLLQYQQHVYKRFSASRGTTQISVADKFGNVASLTTSNGEGSGVMVPGTSIMLNNMLGEEDLFPGSVGNWKPNQRISSMMAPGVLQLKNGDEIAFGSGGSNRIRTAILQVLLNMVAYGGDARKAVNSPRIHLEGEELNIEAGIEKSVTERLEDLYPEAKIWDRKSLFFGGVHLAGKKQNGNFFGYGDERRGGVFLTVS